MSLNQRNAVTAGELGDTLTAPLCAAQTAASPQPLTARLDAVIERAVAEKRIVGTVVLVARDGHVVHRRACGAADREAGRPMKEDAIFLLASVTKAFVAAAALRLVEEGRLDLQDPVNRWLPDFRPRTADGRTPMITVHQLLTHTAGLTYTFIEPGEGPYHHLCISSGLDQPGLTLGDNLRRLAAAPLTYEPGTSWGYSMAFDVLGAVVERASGQSLPEAVQRWVMAPLNLRDTGFAVVDRTRLVAHYADGQPLPLLIGDGAVVPFREGSVRFAPRRIFDSGSYPSGGAGMAGTADDVLALLESLRCGSLLAPATQALLSTPSVGPQAQTQGPGWGFSYLGATLVDAAAASSPQSPGTLQWGGAYGHYWFIDPVRRLSIVALTNTAFEGMVGRFTTEVRDAVYGR